MKPQGERLYGSVFLSYAHADTLRAGSIAERLGARGIAAWIDNRGLRVGDVLTETLKRAIAEQDFFLVLVSAASSGSKWVQREIEFAIGLELQSSSIRVIPLRLDGAASIDAIAERVTIDASDDPGLTAALDAVADRLRTCDFSAPDSRVRKLAVVHAESTFPSIESLFREARNEGGVSTASMLNAEDAGAPSADYAMALEGLAFEAAATGGKGSAGIVYGAASAIVRVLVRDGVGAEHLGRLFDAAIVAPDARKALFRELVQPELSSTAIKAAIELNTGFIRDDASFHTLVFKNQEQLGPHTAAIERYLLNPSRGPGGYNADTFFTALNRHPEMRGLKRRLIEWISDGAFSNPTRDDFEGSRVLFLYLRRSWPQWNAAEREISDATFEQMRSLLKSQLARNFAQGLVMLIGLHAEMTECSTGWPYLAEVERKCLSRVYLDQIPRQFVDIFIDLREYMSSAKHPTWNGLVEGRGVLYQRAQEAFEQVSVFLGSKP